MSRPSGVPSSAAVRWAMTRLRPNRPGLGDGIVVLVAGNDIGKPRGAGVVEGEFLRIGRSARARPPAATAAGQVPAAAGRRQRPEQAAQRERDDHDRPAAAPSAAPSSQGFRSTLSASAKGLRSTPGGSAPMRRQRRHGRAQIHRRGAPWSCRSSPADDAGRRNWWRDRRALTGKAVGGGAVNRP